MELQEAQEYLDRFCGVLGIESPTVSSHTFQMPDKKGSMDSAHPALGLLFKDGQTMRVSNPPGEGDEFMRSLLQTTMQIHHDISEQKFFYAKILLGEYCNPDTKLERKMALKYNELMYHDDGRMKDAAGMKEADVELANFLSELHEEHQEEGLSQ